jgi:hypothetical protein
MAGELWPDVEGALRDYLRADSDMTGIGVWFALPDDPVFPNVQIIRISGGESATSEAPVDLCLVQMDVRGPVKRLSVATAALGNLRKSLSKIRGRVQVAGKADLFGATVIDVRRFPEPNQQDTDGAQGERPRYVLTVQVTALAPSTP